MISYILSIQRRDENVKDKYFEYRIRGKKVLDTMRRKIKLPFFFQFSRVIEIEVSALWTNPLVMYHLF